TGEDYLGVPSVSPDGGQLTSFSVQDGKKDRLFVTPWEKRTAELGERTLFLEEEQRLPQSTASVDKIGSPLIYQPDGKGLMFRGKVDGVNQLILIQAPEPKTRSPQPRWRPSSSPQPIPEDLSQAEVLTFNQVPGLPVEGRKATGLRIDWKNAGPMVVTHGGQHAIVDVTGADMRGVGSGNNPQYIVLDRLENGGWGNERVLKINGQPLGDVWALWGSPSVTPDNQLLIPQKNKFAQDNERKDFDVILATWNPLEAEITESVLKPRELKLQDDPLSYSIELRDTPQTMEFEGTNSSLNRMLMWEKTERGIFLTLNTFDPDTGKVWNSKDVFQQGQEIEGGLKEENWILWGTPRVLSNGQLLISVHQDGKYQLYTSVGWDPKKPELKNVKRIGGDGDSVHLDGDATPLTLEMERRGIPMPGPENEIYVGVNMQANGQSEPTNQMVKIQTPKDDPEIPAWHAGMVQTRDEIPGLPAGTYPINSQALELQGEKHIIGNPHPPIVFPDGHHGLLLEKSDDNEQERLLFYKDIRIDRFASAVRPRFSSTPVEEVWRKMKQPTFVPGIGDAEEGIFFMSEEGGIKFAQIQKDTGEVYWDKFLLYGSNPISNKLELDDTPFLMSDDQRIFKIIFIIEGEVYKADYKEKEHKIVTNEDKMVQR
ncbi:hypothetical protein BVX98_00970, partial [bacterium F11]